MGRIKTYLLAGIISAVSATQSVALDGLSKTFAGCVGRMSAEMEHAWLINSDAADDFEAQRLTFISLLDAVTPPEQARKALAMRVDAKLAHAALLTTASFGTTAQRSTQAKQRARWHVGLCRRLLLDS